MKPWWKSKTVWINVLTLVVALVVAIQDHQWIKTNPNLAAASTMLLAVINVFLRWLVDQPITSIIKPMDRLRPKVMKSIQDKEYGSDTPE
jgi:hypothetical protein